MTKRYSYFKSEITGLFVIVDELHKETFSGMEDEYNCSRIVRKLNTLSEENEQLKSIKKFADRNGICIFNIDEAFRRCWQDNAKLVKENEELKQQLSDINGQLVMLDNCDNWDYDRMKHTVREIAEIIGYNGTINPKR